MKNKIFSFGVDVSEKFTNESIKSRIKDLLGYYGNFEKFDLKTNVEVALDRTETALEQEFTALNRADTEYDVEVCRDNVCKYDSGINFLKNCLFLINEGQLPLQS